MLEIIRRPQAKRDIADAAAYIAENAGFSISDRFLNATARAFDTVALLPRMGVLRDYDNPEFAGMRMWPVPRFEQYLIFYLTADDAIEIVRVLHGSQNIRAIFAPPGDE